MKLSIAIPDSALVDESTQMGKTMKISQIARACAIFQVSTIYLYHEAGGSEHEMSLLRTTLKYLETPQYLRRLLYKKMNELKFAGSLSPLKIPSHVVTADSRKIKLGDVREGVVVFVRGEKYVDAGLEQLIPYYGKDQEGKRIIIRFKDGFPSFTVNQIKKEETHKYWGYEVKESSSLSALVSSWGSYIIFTSRKGKIIHKAQKYFEEIANENVLVVFGSPKRGVHEIMGKALHNVQRSQILNFFHDQATETVRLEEAMLGTLAILNILTHK